MTVICLLVTMGIPLYTRAVEQARADVASAKLRTIWSAQRVYWLENRAYAPALSDLHAMDLLDPSVVASQTAPDAVYVYQITSADNETFVSRAMRNGSGSWVGQIHIDESGRITGTISGPGSQVIVPTP
jgi:type II secretory pathway pseudopilin PulG